jgi:hypothetical protein
MRGIAGIGLGATIKYLRRTTSAATGNSLSSTINYLHGAAPHIQVPALPCGKKPGTTIKYLLNQNAGAGNNRAKAHCRKSVYEF